MSGRPLPCLHRIRQVAWVYVLATLDWNTPLDFDETTLNIQERPRYHCIMLHLAWILLPFKYRYREQRCGWDCLNLIKHYHRRPYGYIEVPGILPIIDMTCQGATPTNVGDLRRLIRANPWCLSEVRGHLVDVLLEEKPSQETIEQAMKYYNPEPTYEKNEFND